MSCTGSFFYLSLGMEKTTNTVNGQGPKTETKPETTTKDQVRAWIRKDLHAAHTLLGLILQDHPDLVDELSDKIFERAMNSPAARIDEVTNQTEMFAEPNPSHS